jgi:hypothetical protein
MRATRASAPGRSRLEDGCRFLRFLHCPLPAVDGMAGADYADAGGEPFLYRKPADAARFLFVGEGCVDADDHGLHSPILWAAARIDARRRTAIV